MDCIRLINAEHLKLEGRPVSRGFQLAVIEQALLYISAGLKTPTAPVNVEEMQAACDDALEALAELRNGNQPFP